jgi:hypothetical protein
LGTEMGIVCSSLPREVLPQRGHGSLGLDHQATHVSRRKHCRHSPPLRVCRRPACVAAEQVVTAARSLTRSLGASGRRSCPGHPAHGATGHTPRQPTDETGRRSPRAPRHPRALLALGSPAKRARKTPLRGYAPTRRLAALCGRAALDPHRRALEPRGKPCRGAALAPADGRERGCDS